MRLSEDGDEIANKDLSDLKRLDRAVIGQIDKNNIYLKKYYNTKNNYSNCSGETTYDMSISASQDYKDIDKLLNEVYQVLRKNLPPDDFEKLKQSEIKWIKDCDKYQELILLRDEYGSWGRQVGIICAETAFREFRTLLLLLYF